MKMTGAGAVVEALHKEKVPILFGIPGGVVIPLFDEIYRNGKFKLVVTKHETDMPGQPEKRGYVL
jgi:acetolactate synthase-1/2/3 large subunit